MEKYPGKVLVIDDDHDVLYTARMILKRRFQLVKTESDPINIPKLLNKEKFDVIVLDMNFRFGQTSGKEGIQWLKKILKIDPDAHVLMNTAYGDIELAVNAMKEGAIDFLVKPWEKEKLLATVISIYELSSSKKEVKRLKSRETVLSKDLDKQYREIVSVSASMNQVFDTAKKVAITDATVLILGENGTGKELLARAIHRESNRSKGPFIKVDLGAISETLFESELFGHAKGAFTDAKEDRAGRFEVASGGTLFLDEIGNLSLSLQAKLLTALQSRQITRVGSNKSIPLDIRLICATNKALYQMVHENEFRQDLLYRINTVELQIPPLRDRTDDIPPLVTHYLDIYTRKYQKGKLKVGKRTMNKLKKYEWPGNIRELQHAIERAVILSDDTDLKESDFILKSPPKSNVRLNSVNLEEVEKTTIMEAIKKCNGNLTKAAAELGFGRSTLYRKMEKYGL